MKRQVIRRPTQAGFTLIELMIVMVIIAILFALSTINLGTPQTVASLNSTVTTLVSDLKSQQLLAMSGNIGSHTDAQPQGIFIRSHDYVLFAGTTYSAGDSNNFAVDAANGVTLSTTLAGNELLFQKGSGEVDSFSATNNTITLSANGSQRVIEVNVLGAIDVH